MPLQNLIRSQIAYPRATGLSEDTQTNTLHWGCDDPLIDRETMQAAIQTPLDAWLGVLDGFMDSTMFVTPATTDWYDMLDPTPRVPFATVNTALTLTNVTSLPMEVTCVISYQGAVTSGVNQARRRGRNYLPTFNVSNIAEASGRVVWSGSSLGFLEAGWEALMTSVEAADCYLAVFSQTTYNGTAGSPLTRLQDSTTRVTSAWVDNEPDTQRRRGGRTGTKTPITWGV